MTDKAAAQANALTTPVAATAGHGECTFVRRGQPRFCSRLLRESPRCPPLTQPHVALVSGRPPLAQLTTALPECSSSCRRFCNNCSHPAA